MKEAFLIVYYVVIVVNDIDDMNGLIKINFFV